MSKQTRKQKKEEEKRILAQMDEAMGETSETTKEEKPKRAGLFTDKTPEQIHCKRCKTLMENGVCPTCGFRMYVPMDKKKQKMIRWIVGGVCLVGFLFLFVWLQTRG